MENAYCPQHQLIQEANTKTLEALVSKVDATRDDIQGLKLTLQPLLSLDGRLDAIDTRVKSLEADRAAAKGRGQVADGMRQWIPVVISMVGFAAGWLVANR